MVFIPTSVVTIDGHKYAVSQGSYTRTWTRFFSISAQASLVTTTFIDRGPGNNAYDIGLLITSWTPSELPYQLGVTETWDVQKANLETAYGKLAKSIQFLDPFGQAPQTSGSTNGVYMVQFIETVLDWSTPSTPYLKIDVQFKEAVGVIIG